MPTMLTVLFSVAFLFMFYRAVESEWPESYSILSTSSSYWSSHSLLHYIGFRLAPVLLISVFATVVAERDEGTHAWLVALGVPLVHWATTSGRKVLRGARRVHRPNNYIPTVLVAFALLMGYLTTALIAWQLRAAAAPLVPGLDEIVAGLWTGLAAGVVAVFLTDSKVTGSPDSYEIVNKAIDDLTPQQRRWCNQYGEANSTDEEVLLTIMIVEQLSRPSWFRSIENLSARILKRNGTYGLMQVHSSQPVGDEESVEIAARVHLPGRRVERDEYDQFQEQQIRQIFASYNPDDSYIDMCLEVFQLMEWRDL